MGPVEPGIPIGVCVAQMLPMDNMDAHRLAIRFGQATDMDPSATALEFLDYEITDAESYEAVVRGAEVEISLLEPEGS